MTMSVNSSTTDKNMDICLGKSFDIRSIKAFRDIYVDVNDRPDVINIDFRAVGVIDASAIGMLRDIYFHFNKDVRVVIHNCNSEIRKIMSLMKLENIITIR